ncbi:hypothetical protein GCM10020229_28130 [Kitasatospora albolonga]
MADRRGQLRGRPEEVRAGPQDGDLAAIETPDERTLVLRFPQPQADVPYMAAQSSSSPVRKDKDTGTDYDRLPFASGPYRIAEHVQNTRLVLERNPHWKPETDPIRNQYPEKFVFSFGKEALNINQEILSGRDGGANATTVATQLSPELYQTTDTDPKAKELVVTGRQGAFVTQLVVNNERVADPEVRKALHLAYPRQQARQVLGGSRVGELATTLSSPALLDWQKYDLYPAKPAGDPEAAKQALAKAKQAPTSLTYAYANTPNGQRVAQVLVDGFAKAGITIVPKPVDAKALLDEAHRADSPYDLFEETSSVDWPTPSTLVPFSFDGRANSDLNSARYRNPAVDKEIDRINQIGEPRQKAKELYALEQTVMKDVPVLPFALPQRHPAARRQRRRRLHPPDLRVRQPRVGLPQGLTPPHGPASAGPAGRTHLVPPASTNRTGHALLRPAAGPPGPSPCWPAVSAAAFVLFPRRPADPARAACGPRCDSGQVAAVRQSMGLDQPLLTSTPTTSPGSSPDVGSATWTARSSTAPPPAWATPTGSTSPSPRP